MSHSTYHDPDLPRFVFYVAKDGSVSMSYDQVWVSALFQSLEAAKSWAPYHTIEAEESFAKLNAATGGKGEKLLGVREGDK